MISGECSELGPRAVGTAPLEPSTLSRAPCDQLRIWKADGAVKGQLRFQRRVFHKEAMVALSGTGTLAAASTNHRAKGPQHAAQAVSATSRPFQLWARGRFLAKWIWGKENKEEVRSRVTRVHTVCVHTRAHTH